MIDRDSIIHRRLAGDLKFNNQTCKISSGTQVSDKFLMNFLV